MPPPDRPCGRTAAAGKWSSCASVVTKTSSAVAVVSSTAPTTRSPGSSRMTSQLSLPSTSGLTRLTTPSAVPRARPSESGASVVRHSTRSSGSRLTSSLTVGATLQVGGVGRGRHGGQVEGVDPDQPARRGDQAAVAPGRGQDPGHDHVVVGPRAGGRDRVGMVGPRQQPGRGQQHPARVVGDLQRRRRRRGDHAAGREQDGAPRRAVLLGDLGQLDADHRAQLLGVLQDLGQLGDAGRSGRRARSPARAG